MQKKTLENLDNGQKEYDCISLLSCSKELVHWRQPEGLTDKKAIDIQYGAYMQKCYHEETKIINTVCTLMNLYPQTMFCLLLSIHHSKLNSSLLFLLLFSP